MTATDVFIVQRETAAAQAFMDGLTDEQRAKAVRAEHPIDLVLGPGKDGATVAPEGIRGSELTAKQITLLLDVIEARLGFMNSDDYGEKMKTVVAGIEDTYFGWWGRQGVPRRCVLPGDRSVPGARICDSERQRHGRSRPQHVS